MSKAPMCAGWRLAPRDRQPCSGGAFWSRSGDRVLPPGSSSRECSAASRLGQVLVGVDLLVGRRRPQEPRSSQVVMWVPACRPVRCERRRAEGRTDGRRPALSTSPARLTDLRVRRAGGGRRASWIPAPAGAHRQLAQVLAKPERDRRNSRFGGAFRGAPGQRRARKSGASLQKRDGTRRATRHVGEAPVSFPGPDRRARRAAGGEPDQEQDRHERATAPTGQGPGHPTKDNDHRAHPRPRRSGPGAAGRAGAPGSGGHRPGRRPAPAAGVSPQEPLSKPGGRDTRGGSCAEAAPAARVGGHGDRRHEQSPASTRRGSSTAYGERFMPAPAPVARLTAPAAGPAQGAGARVDRSPSRRGD